MSTDSHGQPWPRLPGVGVKDMRLNSEHGIVELEAPSPTPRVGDKMLWEAGYSDFTVHLHEVLFGVRGGRVEVAWPVLGRGKIQ
jgi:3-hydroxy-D-aspartate aldolase